MVPAISQWDEIRSLHTHLYQVDEDTEVSNSHVPVEELLFMNLEAAKYTDTSESQPNTSLTVLLLIYGSWTTQLYRDLSQLSSYRDVATSAPTRWFWGLHICGNIRVSYRDFLKRGLLFNNFQVGKSLCNVSLGHQLPVASLIPYASPISHQASSVLVSRLPRPRLPQHLKQACSPHARSQVAAGYMRLQPKIFFSRLGLWSPKSPGK